MTDKEKLIIQMYLQDKKKKKIIISIIISVLIVIILGVVFFFISSQTFKLSNKSIVIEYGEKYIPNLSDFIEIEETINDKNTNMEYLIPNEEGKDYPAIGEYEIEITHHHIYKIQNKEIFTKDFKRKASVEVKDTTIPTFSTDNPQEIKIAKIIDESEKPDLSKSFIADDLSGISSIVVKDDGVDYKTAGNYIITVIATDNNENAATVECNLKIIEPSLVINNKNINLKIGETSTVDLDYFGNQKPQFISDNSNVITVDANGKITAVNKGNATISVECNGLKDYCTVEVVEEQKTTQISKPSGSSKPNKPSSSGNTGSSSSKPKPNKVYKNKDFLFSDGYTMSNVSEAASKYLYESGKSGKCIPLKDSEGIYIGMRVVFD